MKKWTSIILIIVICMASFVSYASNETELNSLQQERNEVQNQISEAQEKIQDIEDDRTENIKQIAKIDEGIESAQKTLQGLNKNVSELEKKLKAVQIKLKEATDKYDAQKQLLDERLVAMYISGDTRYLDVLLASSNIMDLISNYYLMEELVDYDTKLLNKVEEQKKYIEQINNELTTQKNALNTQKQEQLKLQKVLENNKFLRKNYINKLSDQEKELQEKIDEYNNQINAIEQEIQRLAITKSFGENYLGGTMIWPIKDHYTITSQYGMRTHPITGVYKLHTGMDISAKKGDDFIAAAYGMVVKAEYNRAYGNMVIIDHGGGVQTLYAHGSSIEVEVGKVVNAGDVVLKVGSTGYSTGPHAHFEVRINGQYVDPMPYITTKNN